ncbi:hypothetical protein FRC17_000453 [Serendipita sp. 399]|nr:hypothetical protein FRC17_000453 [Serendipita sp. 399]
MGVVGNEKRVQVDWETVWRGDGDEVYKQTAGHRVPMEGPMTVQDASVIGPSLFPDKDGGRQYLGSAIYNGGVHPCKIVPNYPPPCHVPYGDKEIEHTGRYMLLPFDSDTMEWVFTSKGHIPEGRVPVEGGHEEGYGDLYHAAAYHDGVYVPGKTCPSLVRMLAPNYSLYEANIVHL